METKIIKIAFTAFTFFTIAIAHPVYAATNEEQREALDGFEKAFIEGKARRAVGRYARFKIGQAEAIKVFPIRQEYLGRILTEGEKNERNTRLKTVRDYYESIRTEIYAYEAKKIGLEGLSAEARSLIEEGTIVYEKQHRK